MPGRFSFVSLLAVLAAAATFGIARGQDGDPLPPQEAYPFTLEATADRLRLDFAIVDGYYLYRERFEFATATPGLTLGEPIFPAGEIHEDEFFGEQEIYRHEFRIEIPYTAGPGVGDVALEIALQGCADIGLCYPPQHWNRNVTLPPGSGGAGAAGAAAPGAGGLSSLLLDDGSDLLPAEQAFQPNARFETANELRVTWTIAPGYYLYRDKFGFEADGPVELGAARLPEGRPHYDDNFGDVRVFYDTVEAVVPFSRASPDEIPVTIRTTFQGCKENSICYPPSEFSMAMVLPAANEFAPSEPPQAAATAPDLPVAEQDRLADVVISGSWPVVLATFYGLGLLLAFTPCVLPMVPIVSGIVAGQGNVSTGRGFALSLSYVLGMAVTYTVAGALAAIAGGQIQAIFQKPWIVVLFAGIFVVLGLSMFGLFELQMPAAIQTRMANLANRQKGGTFVGTAIIGALSALIVTTCVAPPLVATLAVIGQTGDVMRGSSALFALSLGMGSPLLAVGASAGSLVPKAGAWMNTVKAAFGVMMIGLAIWMMERVLPGTVTLVLWALLVFLTGVFLGAFEPLPAAPPPTKRLAKGLGVLACLYGALMLIGATLGGEDPLRPLPQARLAGLTGGAADTANAALVFEPLTDVAELEAELAAASAAGRPVLVDFTADWCVSCREMEEYTFPDAAVVAALEPFVLLRADVTANDENDQALLEYFGSFGPPTIAFFDAHGTAQPAFKLVGYVPAEEFAAHVGRLAAL